MTTCPVPIFHSLWFDPILPTVLNASLLSVWQLLSACLPVRVEGGGWGWGGLHQLRHRVVRRHQLGLRLRHQQDVAGRHAPDLCK
jgi:hypothetical protein